MKVKMLINAPRQLGCKLTEGETGEVSKKLGDRLIALGIASPVSPPKPLRAVPEPAAIAKPEPPAITPTQEPN
jgi:hypothetical protein